jgi:hypothetical protein
MIFAAWPITLWSLRWKRSLATSLMPTFSAIGTKVRYHDSP